MGDGGNDGEKGENDMIFKRKKSVQMVQCNVCKNEIMPNQGKVASGSQYVSWNDIYVCKHNPLNQTILSKNLSYDTLNVPFYSP